MKQITFFSAVGAVIFFAGSARSAFLPYLSVLALETFGLSASGFAILLVAGSVSSLISALVVGYISDIVKQRSLLIIIAASIGAFSYGFIYFFPYGSYFCIVFLFLMPLATSVLNQAFAFARSYSDQNKVGRADSLIVFLRGIFTISWVIVPPLAGYFVSRYGLTYIFAISSVAYIFCGIGAMCCFRRNIEASPSNHIGYRDAILMVTSLMSTGSVLQRIALVSLVECALTVHASALPYLMMKSLGGTPADVGLAAGITAGFEICFVPVFAWALRSRTKVQVIKISCLCYAIYNVAVFFAATINVILVLQILNAFCISGLLGIIISYIQDSLTERPGLSTSLCTVADVVGSAAAAVIFSTFVHFELLSAPFVAAAIISVSSTFLLKFMDKAPKRLAPVHGAVGD